MTTIYLIRHSIKEKNYGIFDSNDDSQIKNEKTILSVDGEKMAEQLSKHKELQNIDEIWASNYVRAIQTAKYISKNNNIDLNVSTAFDERHYGKWSKDEVKEEFWFNQFLNKNLKNIDGESQIDVQNRMDKKIKEIICNKENKRVAIVCHNACILFYLLKYCNLEEANINKKLTITYKDKKIIDSGIMKSPSIMKLTFNKDSLIDISYFEMD